MVDKIYKIKDVFNLFAGGDVNRTHFSEYKTSTYIFCIYSNSLADHGLYGYTDVPKYSGDSITITGRGSIGHAEYRPFDFDAIIRLLVLIPKDKDIIDSRYVTELINSYVKFPLESTGVPQLTVPQIENIEISLPAIEVQRKIANALSDVDGMISSLEKLIAKYKSIKTACLQQMFPQNGETVPRIRLPGFTGAWEQRKLGELVDVCSGRDYKHLSEGTIPVYGTGGYMLSVNDALSYDRDAIGIGRKGTIDRPYILKAPFWTVDTLFYAIPREKVDLNYAFDIFQNIDWKKKDESTGVPSLSKTAINDIDVLAPKHDEQQIIGQFFAAIDHLITLHQRKLEKVQKIKQGMMQQLLTGKIRLV